MKSKNLSIQPARFQRPAALGRVSFRRGVWLPPFFPPLSSKGKYAYLCRHG